ncbi:MAG: excinuclease ABC subunit UvrC [Actinobacteria bacterium]|nr:excinuclease ABC subunit UvrC [Actinomycetota bacterium]
MKSQMEKCDKNKNITNSTNIKPSDECVSKKPWVSIPLKPGVYIFRDLKGKAIYIGKAKNLRKRVKSYFQGKNRSNLYNKPAGFAGLINSIDYIVTTNEVEALILEGNLIKKNTPRYNISLKDDKSYPFIAVTGNEKYPRVFLTRNRNIKGAKYFGPYTETRAVRKVLEYLRKIFPIRDCKRPVPGKGRKGPCLNYHMGLCPAPCSMEVDENDYRKNIEYIKLFLKGKDSSILSNLKSAMKDYASRNEFEKASIIRDRINDINRLYESQRIFFDSSEAWDFIGLAREGSTSVVSMFAYRNGNLAMVNNFVLENTIHLENEEIIPGFIYSYYEDMNNLPSIIYIPEEISESRLIKEWFKKKKGRSIDIRAPLSGEKKRIMDMAVNNSRLYLEKKKFEKDTGHSQAYRDLIKLKEVLGLKNIPRRIECYDISNLKDTFPVGSMTVAYDGKLASQDYRRFRIRKVRGQDDCRMLEEVISRRLRYLKKPFKVEMSGFFGKPDLIVVDGGKAQFNTIHRVLKNEKLDNEIDLAGIAKKEETIYCSRFGNGIKFDYGMDYARIIIKVRDEAHRFAVNYHRKLRDDYMTNSLLDGIKGIGEKKKQYILQSAGSLKYLKNMSADELMNIKGISCRDAEKVFRSLHR